MREDAYWDDTDLESETERAEQDLHEWMMEPFLEIFEKLEPLSKDQQITLQDFVSPPTYRYTVYGQDGKLQAFLDYAVPNKERHRFLDLERSVSRRPHWLLLQPKDIKIQCSDIDWSLSDFSGKVSVAGSVYYFKSVPEGLDSEGRREVSFYRDLDDLGITPCDEIRVPNLHGLVQEEGGRALVGFLLTWIDCGKKNLESILSSDMLPPYRLRKKWKRQIFNTVTKLHALDFLWGDACPENILIDDKDDAWVIDFQGDWRPYWVEEAEMDSTEGDLGALEKIVELLRRPKEMLERKRLALEDMDGHWWW